MHLMKFWNNHIQKFYLNVLWSIFVILKNNHDDTGYRLNIYITWFWMTKQSPFYTWWSRHQANINRLLWIARDLCVHIENNMKHKSGILSTCLPLTCTCFTVISLILRVFYLSCSLSGFSLAESVKILGLPVYNHWKSCLFCWRFLRMRHYTEGGDTDSNIYVYKLLI